MLNITFHLSAYLLYIHSYNGCLQFAKLFAPALIEILAYF